MNGLKHYGVLGMKWGVRRTPEQLGHKRNKPTYSENRNIRKLKGEYKSAVKNVKTRVGMADDDRKNVERMDYEYERLQKKGLGIRKKTKDKRMADLQNTENLLKKYMKSLEDAEVNQEKALSILDAREKALRKAVDDLNNKYGSDNVKQLEYRKRAVEAGERFVIENVYKTGIRMQDIPLIGKRVVGKQIAQWEREDRYDKRDERIRKRRKEEY